MHSANILVGYPSLPFKESLKEFAFIWDGKAFSREIKDAVQSRLTDSVGNTSEWTCTGLNFERNGIKSSSVVYKSLVQWQPAYVICHFGNIVVFSSYFQLSIKPVNWRQGEPSFCKCDPIIRIDAIARYYWLSENWKPSVFFLYFTLSARKA